MRDSNITQKTKLIKELINRQTFVGIVIFHREDAKAGQLNSGEVVMTKSPPLTREGVEDLLQLGGSLVSEMFGKGIGAVVEGLAAALPRYTDRSPLRLDEGGVVRIDKSRVSLDLVVEQYENGMTPEEMVCAYDTLELADVYAVIAYYLRHGDEVRAYMKRRAEQAEVRRAKIEVERPPIAPAELLTRSSARENDHAPTGQ